MAAMSASDLYGPVRLCAGIVGFADLLLGAEVDAVLEAHLRAAGERFKGVRHPSVWDADPSIRTTQVKYPQGLLLDAKFRAGFARLSRYGLSFDSWNYHTQIAELADLARAFPETTIVLDHIGAPLGVGTYAGRRDEVFADWRRSIRELAACPNVCVKLGGMGMRIFGFGFEEQRAAAVLRRSRHGVAALFRNLHRGVWAAAGDVREQLSGRQGLLQLRHAVERVQEADGGLQRRRQSGAFLQYRQAHLSAADD